MTTQIQAPDTLRIFHKTLDGGIHVWTSPDLPGLYHAHKDYDAGLQTLPLVAADLVRHEFGQKMDYDIDYI